MTRLKSFVSRQKGGATVEWTVATFALTVALFVPWDGNQSAMAMFMDAIRAFYASTTFSISLP